LADAELYDAPRRMNHDAERRATKLPHDHGFSSGRATPALLLLAIGKGRQHKCTGFYQRRTAWIEVDCGESEIAQPGAKLSCSWNWKSANVALEDLKNARR